MCVRGFQGRGAWWSSLLEMVVNGEEPVVNAISKVTRKRPLGKGLSSYQLFKAALNFLSKSLIFLMNSWKLMTIRPS